MPAQEIELEGHIIDSLILPKVFDTIMDFGGEFEVTEFRIGKMKTDPSYAKILVKGKDKKHLDSILGELYKTGARIPSAENAELMAAPKDLVFPDNFYSTTNHPTYILVEGEWIAVEGIIMDKVIVLNKENKTAFTKAFSEVKAGDLIVVGNKGIKVEPPERPRSYSVFEFMRSSVSSEKPSKFLASKIAENIIELKSSGKKIAVVAGPAVVHTGAQDYLAELIRSGYISVLLAGNALAVHDIEHALFGTSLGIDAKTGRTVEAGHRNHLYAINEVMKAGSIKALVESEKLKRGIMYECIKNNVPFVLAGSIRDDGPIPEVIRDIVEAQKAMKQSLKGVELVLMLSTMLHSIAIGNMLPSYTKTICIDINPATVIKLTDRGSAQALGIVSDVGVFLPVLARELRKKAELKAKQEEKPKEELKEAR